MKMSWILPFSQPIRFRAMPTTFSLLRRQRPYSVSPAAIPWPGGSKFRIQEIKDEPLIMFSDGFYQNVVIKERFEREGLRPNIIHYSSQFYTIREFISDGIAAGFMFRSIADTVPEIRGISLKEPIGIRIGLVWKKYQHMFHDALQFLSFAKQYGQTMGEKES